MKVLRRGHILGQKAVRVPLVRDLCGVVSLFGLLTSVSCSSGKMSFGNRMAEADGEFVQKASHELAQASPQPGFANGGANQITEKKDNGSLDATQTSSSNSIDPGDPRQNFGGNTDEPLNEDSKPTHVGGTAANDGVTADIPINIEGGPIVSSPSPKPANLGHDGVAEEVVDECLKSWKEAGISEESTKSYTQKHVDVSLGNASGTVVFSDVFETSSPHFMIVSIKGNNMNSAVAELLNPQGWYCVHLDAKNMNGFKFFKKKSAKLKILSQDYQNANGFKIDEVD